MNAKTSGMDIDADGYAVTVNSSRFASKSRDVSANGTTTISVVPGTAAHATMLKLVSGNNQSADQCHQQHR